MHCTPCTPYCCATDHHPASSKLQRKSPIVMMIRCVCVCARVRTATVSRRRANTSVCRQPAGRRVWRRLLATRGHAVSNAAVVQWHFGQVVSKLRARRRVSPVAICSAVRRCSSAVTAMQLWWVDCWWCRRYCSAVHWHLGHVMLRNITCLIFAVFDV